MVRPPAVLRLSLSGAGFLGSYHLGVGRALRERLKQPSAQVAGASAGAIVGAVLVSETPMEAARASLQALVAHTLAAPLGVLTPGFSLDTPELAPGTAQRQWLERTKSPFFIMTNYASPTCECPYHLPPVLTALLTWR